ncbi:MAG: hypothetical protein ACD_49C00074G0009 [uncultured bacterium (gcode 4)]|uniref:L,D-TPase catalytic domain-containing protein n=1 Tax=uncultured bacterium (gcode 4) TaxID=1234023 RepID=K2AVN1_9BACT|nr:MAG: hypothetical protein ACD_49C00074G0009 [uncultured bacterium (gcode 4)]
MKKHLPYVIWLAWILTITTPNYALEEVTIWTKNAVEKVLDNPTCPVKIEEKPVIQQEIPNIWLAKKKISEMKETPLDMKWIWQKDNLKQFFWLNQYKLIFEKYNPEVVKKDKKWNIIDDKNTYSQNELAFPLVFDSLKTTFPESLDEFVAKNEEFKKDIKDGRTVIVITKNSEKKFVMAYYKEWKLTLATHISPGMYSPDITKQVYNEEKWKMETVIVEEGWINSPTWTFHIEKNDGLKYKRSIKHKRSPMPYALQITWWVFLHHWTNVDGTKRSHGCIRVPGFYQEALYSQVETKTKIVIKYTNS